MYVGNCSVHNSKFKDRKGKGEKAKSKVKIQKPKLKNADGFSFALLSAKFHSAVTVCQVKANSKVKGFYPAAPYFAVEQEIGERKKQ